MMIPVTDEHKFWQLTSAAESIFAFHRYEIPSLTGTSAWGFVRGNVSEDRADAYAAFSCRSASGWGDDELTISAKKQLDGSWNVSHTVRRA